MKTLLIIISVIFSSSTLSLSQKSDNWVDSVKFEAQNFFKKVEKIELVELIPYHVIQKYRRRLLGVVVFTKKYDYYLEESIIYSGSKIDTTHIGKRHELNSKDFDTLFDLLYNSELSNTRAACYNPRHGIIFYNSNGEINGFLEICFECNRIHSFPETPNLGPPISQKFDELKKLFTP